MNRIRKATAILLAMFALFAAGLVGLLSLAIDDQPSVKPPEAVDYQTVASSKSLLQRLLQQLESASSSTTIAITESELIGLARMGSQSIAELSARIAIQQQQLQPAASLALPRTPFGRYLNISFAIPSSDAGLTVSQLTVGSLPVPGSLLLPAAAMLADALLPEEQPSLMLDMISAVEIREKTALISVSLPAQGNLKSDIKKTVRRVQAARFPPGEQQRVLHYYDLLASIDTGASFDPHSLTVFLVPLMAAAAEQADKGSAVAENRAAIWAMAIYFSHGAFEKLVGDLVTEKRPLVYPAFNVTLLQRRDLMQHFVYSAAITLATRQGIGIATGEFKELLDSGANGSGFSFVDLAADRAGVLFAANAVASEEQARRIQQAIIDHGDEASFFPDINGLEEGLDDAQFIARFGNTGTPAYRQQVALIDRRIASLPVHQ